ncbi:hypothetical protein HN807_00035 [Candidatus Bathyarchaeota archaeon]|nr:hypothetical protein [Candidatus Bathyarchaeota archaeon]MBT4319289.1 hypothetical protein [Candidatus Bathyarchaeota archaeon]MBT4422901.1 hypothetical protein [Candidatus Bathyarchaeota archaeon]MBT6603861.1 hypothetical protein [Candidatus Bathyarchaeota archaeon]MBT7187021.1 hypothetical protein [Candidatus Bathyarchaeota archaeon]
MTTSSEVIHCPNCKEDVPRTLYCLNCGYPLYKLEQEEKVEDQAEEPVTETEPEVKVDMSVEYEPPQETFMVEEPEPEVEPAPEPEPEVEIEVEEEPEAIWEQAPEEKPAETSEPDYEPEIEEDPETIWEPEPEPEAEVESETVSELEEEPETVFEPEPTHEPVIDPEIEQEVITKEEREEYMMDEIMMEYAPDPLSKEVMDNLAKNITLKVRLVRLLRDNSVKEETFRKLFDNYVDQGRLWVSRRDDTITRLKSDLERMETEFVAARKDFELLEIRKNIGDAGEDEYGVKAPAFKWDIEHLDTEIKSCKGGIQYMINLKSLVPGEEVAELESLGQADYSSLDNIEDVTSDTIARMKESLAEALNTIQG